MQASRADFARFTNFKMADRKRTWASFKNQMKAKTGPKDLKILENINKAGKHNILDRKELVVQRLTAEVSGKAQKYTRVGPLVHVNLSPTRMES